MSLAFSSENKILLEAIVNELLVTMDPVRLAVVGLVEKWGCWYDYNDDWHRMSQWFCTVLSDKVGEPPAVNLRMVLFVCIGSELLL